MQENVLYLEPSAEVPLEPTQSKLTESSLQTVD